MNGFQRGYALLLVLITLAITAKLVVMMSLSASFSRQQESLAVQAREFAVASQVALRAVQRKLVSGDLLTKIPIEACFRGMGLYIEPCGECPELGRHCIDISLTPGVASGHGFSWDLAIFQPYDAHGFLASRASLRVDCEEGSIESCSRWGIKVVSWQVP